MGGLCIGPSAPTTGHHIHTCVGNKTGVYTSDFGDGDGSRATWRIGNAHGPARIGAYVWVTCVGCVGSARRRFLRDTSREVEIRPLYPTSRLRRPGPPIGECPRKRMHRVVGPFFVMRVHV